MSIKTELTWLPGGAQGNEPEFECGDQIVVAVRVAYNNHKQVSRIRDGKRHEWWEFYILYIYCDSETPVQFTKSDGDSWSEWDWSDVDWYAKFGPKLPVPEISQ